MKPGAIVLCGGESRRMGHSKAWLPFGPERLLQRVVRLVATVAAPIAVVGAEGQGLPDLPKGVRIVRDPIAGRGPLQGMAAGLAALPDGVPLVYATGTDVPFLEPRWITRLEEVIGDHDLAIPMIGGEYHPLAALYRRATVLPAIKRMLDQDTLRVKGLVERVRSRVVSEEELRTVDPRLWTVRNLNRSEEYEQALRDEGFIED